MHGEARGLAYPRKALLELAFHARFMSLLFTVEPVIRSNTVLLYFSWYVEVVGSTFKGFKSNNLGLHVMSFGGD